MPCVEGIWGLQSLGGGHSRPCCVICPTWHRRKLVPSPLIMHEMPVRITDPSTFRISTYPRHDSWRDGLRQAAEQTRQDDHETILPLVESLESLGPGHNGFLLPPRESCFLQRA